MSVESDVKIEGDITTIVEKSKKVVDIVIWTIGAERISFEQLDNSLISAFGQYKYSDGESSGLMVNGQRIQICDFDPPGEMS